jgi:5-formyltetrahydrofolate cyclo-ligase
VKASSFSSKAEARHAVWDALTENKAARFPFPTHGRIPNFAGAKQAAERLMAHPIFKDVECIKVNPDSPQRYVREEALKRGIMVIVPTPRLKGGFKKFDPTKIPPDKYAEAANLSTSERWAEEVPLKALPGIDLIVTGSVAVTRDGRRCGKGHGYGDLEYAIYRELGHPPAAVVTTVHMLQVVNEFPTDPHDLPVSLIATPEEVIEVANPPPSPEGVDWERLPARALEEMPVLRSLRELKTCRGPRQHGRKFALR